MEILYVVLIKLVAFDKYSDDNLPVLSVPVEKMNREKARLQLLLINENKKNVPHNEIQEPKQKQKIYTEQIQENRVQCVKDRNEMIGKRVCHLSSDENGKTKWFNGTVICSKPGTVSEMIIRYNGYATYSFDFSEFSENLLKLIPLDPEFIVRKFIMHKFCDENEVE